MVIIQQAVITCGCCLLGGTYLAHPVVTTQRRRRAQGKVHQRSRNIPDNADHAVDMVCSF